MNFLRLTDLSIYIDLTKCFSYVFFDKILQELSYYLKVLGSPQIKTLYIKYETSGLGNDSDLESFLTSLSQNFDFLTLDEFTFELHPLEITLSLLAILNDFSVSRISIDIKSFSSKLLKVMGVYEISVAEINNAVNGIRKFDFDLNIDLNVNIPYQEKMHLRNDLVKLVACAPEHICLSEILVDGENCIIDFFKDVSSNYNEAKAEDFWFYAFDFLESNGYMNYEISNFALKGHESKHNLRYWELKPYLGLGVNSVSLLVISKGDGLKAVIKMDDNFLGVGKSTAAFEILSDLDFFICHFITNLGTKKGLEVSVLKRRFIYNQEDFCNFINYLLRLSKGVVFSNDILYLDGHERFKLDFYLRLIREYLVSNSFKVNFKFL
ncbi:HemN-related non-iron pseudo-SAM protein PsgB [Borrelia turicatae]|uniref:Coproporphyrinogen oxidase, anaerobic n=1 Tax=Borrelia turicatae (strain 91E135) TaxID=314724 RepID=A0ABF7PW73_BORT9|nr:HemN-related non-iron pseudo-SAM protein PsgB [Borrelia turicatae]AAX17973.1 coproporphyrinogen oxidase, anaerobic [Borrelia turicatae 91E135]UPA13479.1 HemN-related non-iron pseudo-SAM protein PsgB [Borrelia turicatae 91E135]